MGPSGEFRVLSPASELAIPTAWPADAPRAGTPVRAGDVLLETGPGYRAEVLSGQPLPRSPVSGTVVGVREGVRTDGTPTAVVVVQPGPFQHDGSPRLSPRPFSEQLLELLGGPETRLRTWAAMLWSSGTAVDRPTTPDLRRQVELAMSRPPRVDHVLVTAVDPDPRLTVLAGLVEAMPPDLVAGAFLLARLSGAGRLSIVVDPSVAERVRRELARLAAEGSRVAVAAGLRVASRVLSVATTYPDAFPSLLVNRVLGRRVLRGSADALSAAGVLLVDAAAAIAVGRAVRHDQPLLYVPVGVYDHRSGRAAYLRVPVGMCVDSMLSEGGMAVGADAAGVSVGGGAGRPVPALGPLPPPVELRRGDVLQELKVPAAALVTGSDLYFHVLSFRPAEPSEACVRCGWCVEACPTGVNAAGVLEAVQVGRSFGMSFARGVLSAGVERCVECGLCQYVCPSRLPLLSAMRAGLSEVEVRR